MTVAGTDPNYENMIIKGNGGNFADCCCLFSTAPEEGTGRETRTAIGPSGVKRRTPVSEVDAARRLFTQREPRFFSDKGAGR